MVLLVIFGLDEPAGITDNTPALMLGAVGATAVFIYGLMAIVRRSVLRSFTPERLLGLYPTLMFLTIALAESIPMTGFVLSLLSNSAWPYLVGLALAVPGLVIAAPTSRGLERLRDEHVPGVDIFGAFAITGWGGTTA